MFWASFSGDFIRRRVQETTWTSTSGMRAKPWSNASGAVTEITTPVTIQAWFDPGVLQQPAGWIPNPDDILGNLTNASLKTGKLSGTLGAGQVLLAPITISV